jgi:hypothetical protein
VRSHPNPTLTPTLHFTCRYDGGQPVRSYRVRVTTASNVIFSESPQPSEVRLVLLFRVPPFCCLCLSISYTSCS